MAIKLAWWMYIAWAVLLIFQNAGMTWITRARAGKDIKQHALATVVTQCIGFVSGFMGFDSTIRVIQERNWILAFSILAFYTCCNLIGGTGSHWILLRRDERKKLNEPITLDDIQSAFDRARKIRDEELARDIYKAAKTKR